LLAVAVVDIVVVLVDLVVVALEGTEQVLSLLHQELLIP
jgi:hypothetical protein